MHRVTRIHVYNDTRLSFSRMLHHDIALFEVKPPFRFSRTIRPIHLPRSGNETQCELLVCGWGYTNVENVSESDLRYVNTDLRSRIPTLDKYISYCVRFCTKIKKCQHKDTIQIIC